MTLSEPDEQVAQELAFAWILADAEKTNVRMEIAAHVQRSLYADVSTRD